MEKSLREQLSLGIIQQDRLLKRFSRKGVPDVECTVKSTSNNGYFLIAEDGYYSVYFHICCECNGKDIILLNDAHQILIKRNVFDLFEIELLEEISWDTVVRLNDKNTECYLYCNKLFAYANSDGEQYGYEFSDLSPYKENLLRTVYKFMGVTPDVFELMHLIAETPDFTLEYNITDLLSYEHKPGYYTLLFSKNRSTQYQINVGHLVLVKSESKPSKFPTSDELAERQKPALYKFILEAVHNYFITIPAKYSNLIFTRCIERLCKEKGYTYVGQVISTCAGKSDGTHSVEFADFPTAEKVSQKLIDEIDAIITCAIKNPEAPNEIVFHNPYMVRSPTFITYMNNLCDTNKFRFTYNITTNLISLTLY